MFIIAGGPAQLPTIALATCHRQHTDELYESISTHHSNSTERVHINWIIYCNCNH